MSQRWEDSSIPRKASTKKSFLGKDIFPQASLTRSDCLGTPNFSGNGVWMKLMGSITQSESLYLSFYFLHDIR